MLTVLMLTLAACGNTETPKEPPKPAMEMPKVAPPPAAAAKPKSPEEMTVLDIAAGSPDHTTLTAAVKAAGLVDALNSPGGIYTVFAPTDAAFKALPAGTVEGLLVPEKKQDLKLILQHHAMVPILAKKDMKDGMVLNMSDGKTITLHVTGDTVKADDATIVGEVHGVNGVVYVVDQVILPK